MEKRAGPAPRFKDYSGVEHHVREGTADADEAQALLQLFVADGEGHVLVDLTFQAFLDAGRAGAAAAVVGEMEAGILGFFEDVLVLCDVYGDAAFFEGDFVSLSHDSLSTSQHFSRSAKS